MDALSSSTFATAWTRKVVTTIYLRFALSPATRRLLIFNGPRHQHRRHPQDMVIAAV